jgi:hypothetical protein
MIRRISPVDRLQVTDEDAKAKMLLVLGVVSGDQTISEACRQAGVQALTYYKLEERLMGGMYQAALMPPARRGRRSKGPAAEEEERSGGPDAAPDGVYDEGTEGESSGRDRPEDADGDEGAAGAVVGS